MKTLINVPHLGPDLEKAKKNLLNLVEACKDEKLGALKELKNIKEIRAL